VSDGRPCAVYVDLRRLVPSPPGGRRPTLIPPKDGHTPVVDVKWHVFESIVTILTILTVRQNKRNIEHIIL